MEENTNFRFLLFEVGKTGLIGLELVYQDMVKKEICSS